MNKNKKTISYSDHAEKRMYERGITKETVEQVIDEWDVIEFTPEENKYLLWGKDRDFVLHVSCVEEYINYHVVTLYYPSKSYFSEKSNYRERCD
ncbi:MAG: DUF4258 domain-containing protein [Candidatus Heimdallarchaeaceae archaeon]